MKSNQGKYGRLVEELANDFNKSRDSYPDTLTAAYELMLHDVRDEDSRQEPHENPGLAFNTVGEGGKVSATNTKVLVLLDSQSTVNVFCNKDLLNNIREAPNTCRISYHG
jgi:hypothetical protein